MHVVPTSALGQAALDDLGHSTGRPEQMSRATFIEGMNDGFRPRAYAKEELRAELSAIPSGTGSSLP